MNGRFKFKEGDIIFGRLDKRFACMVVETYSDIYLDAYVLMPLGAKMPKSGNFAEHREKTEALYVFAA
jgi:hypothetical protein